VSLSNYWSKLRKTPNGWIHPDDELTLLHERHSFNLDFPPPAFVGNVKSARVIILAANGGYDPVVTPSEFAGAGSSAAYVERLAHPEKADWFAVAPYYTSTNYGELLFSGVAAVVNACAYRSPKISKEPENRRVIAKLSSVRKNLEWLMNNVLPRAEAGECLIVGKRNGLWNLPAAVKYSAGYIADPTPVSPHLSKVVLARVRNLLGHV
jgi:hypothetical protein